MGDHLDESGIFDASLSMWKGIKQNKDGTFSYKDEDFDPTPLDFYTAASLGEEEVVQDILDRKGIRPNALNSGGWSALMYASYMGHNGTVQCLLDADADPNQRSPSGYTSLILASMCGNDTTMGLLIQRGADVEAVDKRGWTALFHAVSSGHQLTTEFLLKVGANRETLEPSLGLTPLLEAAASGHEMIVHQLLRSGADSTRTDYHGRDAAGLAITSGHTNIARMIEQHRIRRPKPAGYDSQHKKNNTTDKHNTARNKCGHSGPSIHAGPKAFAQMTGLGHDGMPHPHPTVPSFLQDQPSHETEAPTTPAKWDGPKDLETLLADIGCSKHYSIFKEEDVDLHIFLTLSEADLKEIGIKLFGPRRKMQSAIARLTNDIYTKATTSIENAYADALNAKLQRVQTQLKQTQEAKEDLEGQVAQERELRRVTEGVLLGHKDVWSSLRRLSDKWSSAQAQLGQNLDLLRSNNFQPAALQSHNRNPRRDKDEIGKVMTKIDNAFRQNRECLLEMQANLHKTTSTSGSKSAGGGGGG